MLRAETEVGLFRLQTYAGLTNFISHGASTSARVSWALDSILTWLMASRHRTFYNRATKVEVENSIHLIITISIIDDIWGMQGAAFFVGRHKSAMGWRTPLHSI